MDVAATHRVADQVEVQTVSAEDILFSQMTELGKADRAARTRVIHGVPALAVGIRRFDNRISAQVCDLAAVITLTKMFVNKRPVEGDQSAVYGFDEALF